MVINAEIRIVPSTSDFPPNSQQFTGTSLRLMRLLALYRCTTAVALILATAGGLQSPTTPVAFAYMSWALISFMLFGYFRGPTTRLLLIQLLLDLGFIWIVLNDANSPTTLYAVYLFPILAAHGWYLRNKTAFAHAALATLTLLFQAFFPRHGNLQEISLAAVLGIGFFLLVTLGLLLGRTIQESEHRAESRSIDLRRLAHINQMVISELADGVLVVSAQGKIIMANPQARRWLAGDEALMSSDSHLKDWSLALHERWQHFFHGTETFSAENAEPIRFEHEKRLLAPRMMPVDFEEKAGTLIFLEDVEQAQAQAQQIKLAALGRLSASIAHEIRNPLSAIKQASQLIAEEVHERPQAQVLTAMIEKNVSRIDRIVRDVSLLGRRDRGAPSELDIGLLLKNVVSELRDSLPMTTNAVTLFQSQITTVWADRSHVEEMLVNLISNAWRHSSQSAECIRIELQRNNQMQRAIINVIDDGVGVSPDIADRIFEPFFSGSGSTGLGLYLVRELALANGGNVRLGSSSKGARFVLELALAPSAENSPNTQ